VGKNMIYGRPKKERTGALGRQEMLGESRPVEGKKKKTKLETGERDIFQTESGMKGGRAWSKKSKKNLKEKFLVLPAKK